MWNELLHAIERQIVYSIFKVQVASQIAPSLLDRGNITLTAPSKEGDRPLAASEGGDSDKNPATSIDPGLPRVGRNDPCPCGSGKKYKKCHGA
jgi:preprotein translocase subunit SecA